MADWIDKRIEEVYSRQKMTPEERDFLFSELIKNIGTQTAQQQNLLLDRMALGDASAATERSTMAGLGYQGALAAGRGGAAIQKYGYDVNRQAERDYMAHTLSKAGLTLQRDLYTPTFGDYMLQAIGSFGQGAGDVGGRRLAMIGA